MRHRVPVRIVLAALLLAVLLVVLHPLVRLDVLSQGTRKGTAYVRVVPTGLMPVQARIEGGTERSLRPGQPGTLVSRDPGEDDVFVARYGADITPWWWAIFVVCWSAPLLAGVVAAWPRKVRELA